MVTLKLKGSMPTDGDDLTPFATLFTGMIFANLYWCANQYVIQRMAARNLAEGRVSCCRDSSSKK